MRGQCRALLRAFCGQLKEWSTNSTLCKDALEALERFLQALAPTEPNDTNSIDSMASMMIKVPSGTLQAHLSAAKASRHSAGAARPAGPGADLLTAQDEYMILQEAVHAARQLLASLKATCLTFQQCTAQLEQGAQGANSGGGVPDLICEPDSVDITLVDEPVEQHQGQQGPATADGQELLLQYPMSEHEVGLMMDVLLTQLQAELALMEKMCCINLATPAMEVNSCVFLCDLQPFVDSRIVETLNSMTQEEGE